MALKNTKTGEYVKIDFGYLPQPVAKLFKTQEQRQNFNPEFDNYKKINFDTKAFNEALKTAVPDTTLSFIDNFKKQAYIYLKAQLNKDEEIFVDC